MKQITKVGIVLVLGLMFNATTHAVGFRTEVSGTPTIKKAEQQQVIKPIEIKPVAQATPVATPTQAPAPVKQAAPSGACGDWIAAAGISDVQSALKLIARESGCNPYAVNRSSGACGVGQALPCSKTGCAMGDGYCQVRWMNSYVVGRYGTWANALNHSYSFNWY